MDATCSASEHVTMSLTPMVRNTGEKGMERMQETNDEEKGEILSYGHGIDMN